MSYEKAFKEMKKAVENNAIEARKAVLSCTKDERKNPNFLGLAGMEEAFRTMLEDIESIENIYVDSSEHSPDRN